MTSHQSAVGGIVVDADGAIGHVAATYATDLGLAAPTTKASVFVAVQACEHLGALGIYAVQAADAGGSEIPTFGPELDIMPII